jgi:hypothetical protein
MEDSSEQGGVQTSLSFEQLVANSVKQKEDMLGRELTADEKKEVEEKVRKYFPNAKSK